MKHLSVWLGALLLWTGAAIGAQGPDLNGWFRLNRAASRITTGVGLTGLGQGGAPHTLFITQAANGTITVGSDINESQSRLYRIDGDSALAAGQGETIPIKARRDGSAIVVEGAGVKETLWLSADGQTLTVSVAAAPGTTTLIYGRMQKAEACTEWPTPCRRKF